MNFNIQHDENMQKFFTTVSGKECSLKYEKVNDQLLDFKLLFVPANLRGQGLADRIAEFSFDYAKKNGIQVKVSCSYIQEYLNKHNALNALVAK